MPLCRWVQRSNPEGIPLREGISLLDSSLRPGWRRQRHHAWKLAFVGLAAQSRVQLPVFASSAVCHWGTDQENDRVPIPRRWTNPSRVHN